MPVLEDITDKKVFLQLLITVCIILYTGIFAHSQTLFGPEYSVKAAFVYNFTKFVEWPEEAYMDANDFIILCIIPDSPNTDVFLSLQDKKVRGKRIIVKKCDKIEELQGCNILFLDSTDKAFIQKVLRETRDRNILTIGHMKGFSQDGGIINFFTEEGRLRFEVNLDAAQRADLKLGSQILMSAEIIKKEKK